MRRGWLIGIVKEKGMNRIIDIGSAFIDKPRTSVEVGWTTDSYERREEPTGFPATRR